MPKKIGKAGQYGLSLPDQEKIRGVLRSFPEVEEAVIFGSRALGNFKKGSDIDLALKGPIDPSLMARLRARLEEELPLPYFFDVVVYRDIASPDLKEHIDKYGLGFYRR